jgi:hypothetical protein
MNEVQTGTPGNVEEDGSSRVGGGRGGLFSISRPVLDFLGTADQQEQRESQ